MYQWIDSSAGRMRIIILRYGKGPGILWIHGGGYVIGMAEMVYFSRGRTLARHFGGTVVSPAYRLAGKAAYPAALEDCYAALKYMYGHAEELGIDKSRIIVGGESAGGGLAAALCRYAKDLGEIPVSFQIPLYPMLDCEDTDSSRNHHSWGWGTKRNHFGWRRYLGDLYGSDQVPPYASPARATDYTGLPPCYTFVEDKEPLHDETLNYVRNLNAAGIEARADVFHGNVHGFDMLFWTANAKQAKKNLIQAAEKYLR